jgi:hypothetical protein
VRVLTWERYVPDVEDNRARHGRGDPALVVELRPPTARVWREFWGAVAEDEPRRLKLAEIVKAHGDEGPARALTLALWDDELAGILWRGGVRAVDLPDGYVEGLDRPIRNGGELWAARDVLDYGGSELYTDVLRALVDRTLLDAGLVDFLALRSGRADSPERDGSRAGIVASVGTPD